MKIQKVLATAVITASVFWCVTVLATCDNEQVKNKEEDCSTSTPTCSSGVVTGGVCPSKNVVNSLKMTCEPSEDTLNCSGELVNCHRSANCVPINVNQDCGEGQPYGDWTQATQKKNVDC